MKPDEAGLLADRETRNAARSLFDSRLAQVKSDLSARGIGGRIADKAKDDARATLTEAVAVARDSKGIIAATAGALALWFFRGPLMAKLAPFLDRVGSDGTAAEEDNDDQR